MNNSSLLMELSADFKTFTSSSVSLSDEQIERAIAIAEPLRDESRKWFTYLNALALFGFENWLEERGDGFGVDRENCSIFQPEVANIIEAVWNLKVNEFRVCLIAVGSLFDDVVTVPRAVLDLPEYAAQFYVLVNVEEELETVAVSGFISYPDLITAKTEANLQPEADWTYSVPLEWFEADSDRLLLYLRCLEPAAIPVPEAPARQPLLSDQQSQLQRIFPQLQPPTQGQIPQLWDLLNWEQGTAILTCPELLQWVYRAQNSANLEGEMGQARSVQTESADLQDLLKRLTEPAVNLGRWFGDGLDNLASELSWVFFPQFSTAAGMRSRLRFSEDFKKIREELERQEIEIPDEARGGYRDLQLAETALRLYALAWELESDEVREWKLLVILGTPSQIDLPHQVWLRVSDTAQILNEQGLSPGENYPYIFTSAIGTLDETFIVTVGLGSDIQETLPPFAFNPQL